MVSFSVYVVAIILPRKTGTFYKSVLYIWEKKKKKGTFSKSNFLRTSCHSYYPNALRPVRENILRL
jgi:hypothetical protein